MKTILPTGTANHIDWLFDVIADKENYECTIDESSATFEFTERGEFTDVDSDEVIYQSKERPAKFTIEVFADMTWSRYIAGTYDTPPNYPEVEAIDGVVVLLNENREVIKIERISRCPIIFDFISDKINKKLN